MGSNSESWPSHGRGTKARQLRGCCAPAEKVGSEAEGIAPRRLVCPGSAHKSSSQPAVLAPAARTENCCAWIVADQAELDGRRARQ